MTENNIKLYPYYSILVLYIKFEIFLRELLLQFFSFFSLAGYCIKFSIPKLS